MPFDVAASVLENRRLSPDYSVLMLDAPEIARLARPGQFVMLKQSSGFEPLLRRPFSVCEPGTQAWMVAGGVGLAPFATLAEALAERGTDMTLFYGGRSVTDLYYVAFFERLGATVVLATEDGSRGV